jgi:hypothetical protein
MTITTTIVTVLRRFKYLAEKVMYSNHYRVIRLSCQPTFGRFGGFVSPSDSLPSNAGLGLSSSIWSVGWSAMFSRIRRVLSSKAVVVVVVIVVGVESHF